MVRRCGLILCCAVAVAACGDSSTSRAIVTPLDAPTAAGSAEPHLARSDDGTIVLSWLEPRGSGVALRHSTLRGGVWQAARTVAEGADWFVNWADFPSVVPISGDLWAAHWLVEQPAGSPGYDVAIALSLDGGQTWFEAITPHTDGTPTEHGFVSLYPWHDGVGALWLDGRNLVAGPSAQAASSEVAGTALRTVSIAQDRTLSGPGEIDTLVCDCCQTDVAVGPDGPIAVYRDRTPGEVRDIHVTRAIEGVWEPGHPVASDGWTITGCPVNGPAVAATGDHVAVAWFTAAGEMPRVQLALSADRGNSFGRAIEVDVTDALGRVDVEVLDDGDAVVSWLRDAGEVDADIVLRRVSRTGHLGAIVAIARTGGGRPAGFPQLIREGDFLVLAWTDTSVEPSRVRTARLAVPSLEG